ncbi:SPRY domain-containing protein 3 [Phytophthora boehmeriae]|uniref:SPRY domain-containing protein 3 n=1 Tax=Phytophthora boehmeriae TaxID=109152 RepID=A0A8T1WJB1_9STRA|nr:SPRY domain-containing protein 3 [Phytophthora boehmeriae]
MCQGRGPSLSKKQPACRLTALDDVLLAQILRFSSARDVEALTVAARVVAKHVLPRFPELWRSLFVQRWATLNFPLADVAAGLATIEVEPRLRGLFPKSCTESRVYQLLTHAIVPVPSYADLDQTKRSQGYSDAKHEPSHVVRFAFNGEELGDDRSVRANVPFPPTFHVGVFKRRELKDGKEQYQIGFVASGYFEISIVQRDPPVREAEANNEGGEQVQTEEEALTSLGLVRASFPLVGRQPGWNQRSYGYHGDDGRFYRQTTRGRHFGPRFGVNDTVGCGVRRNMNTTQSRVFFTSNGEELRQTDENEVACPHTSWYPAVGVDSYNEVRLNFGQEPFAHDSIVDELFAECDPSTVSTKDLPWHSIQEYSIGSLAWRQQTCEAHTAESDTDANDATSKEDETAADKETGMKNWIGMLTRRQQNRLASNEENASEERAFRR